MLFFNLIFQKYLYSISSPHICDYKFYLSVRNHNTNDLSQSLAKYYICNYLIITTKSNESNKFIGSLHTKEDIFSMSLVSSVCQLSWLFIPIHLFCILSIFYCKLLNVIFIVFIFILHFVLYCFYVHITYFTFLLFLYAFLFEETIMISKCS